MLISFTPERALDLARLTWAGERRASDAAARPVLGSMFLEWEPEGKGGTGLKVTAVTTDSFIMGYRQFVTLEGHAVENGEKATGSALIADLIGLERALKAAAKGNQTVVIAFDATSVEIGDVLGNVTHKLALTQGTFPKYRQLIPDGHMDYLDCDKAPTFKFQKPKAGADGDPEATGLSPKLLVRVTKLFDNQYILVGLGAQTTLKPWGWTATGQTGAFYALQMPLRYNGRKS